MKKFILGAAVLSLAFLVSFSPTVGSAQTASCPDVDAAKAMLKQMTVRSEERRVGKECSLLCRSRWSPYH